MRRRLALVAAVLLTLATAGPAAAAERPNTCGAAGVNSPPNKWLTDTLAPAGDVDWFRFRLTSAARVLITLGDLPADYRLDLYSACGTRIAGSDRPGVQFEELYRSLAIGTYRVRISSASAATSEAPYVLRFRPLPHSVTVLSSTTWVDDIGYRHIAGEVLNNTAYNRRFVRINATIYNESGVVIDTDFTYADLDIVKARSRSSFELLFPEPTGYARVRLTVSSSTTTAKPLGGLKVSAGIASVDDVGYFHWPGEVTNSNTFTAQFVQMLLTVYGARGQVLNTDFTFTNPYNVGAGQVAPFELLVGERYDGNRLVLAVQGRK